jgi:hypothetical protein
VQYDFLIVAAGAQSSYYGHEEWRQWAPYPKSIDRSGKPLPGLAQVAMQGGAYAAKSIEKNQNGTGVAILEYLDEGNLAVIGRAAAVANAFGFQLSGLPAWPVWAFIHLMYIVQFQSRVLVFIQWALQDLTFSRGARMITGTTTTDFNILVAHLGRIGLPGVVNGELSSTIMFDQLRHSQHTGPQARIIRIDFKDDPFYDLGASFSVASCWVVPTTMRR